MAYRPSNFNTKKKSQMKAAGDLRFLPTIIPSIYIWYFSIKEKIIKNTGNHVNILSAE